MMTLTRVIAKKPTDKSKAQKSRREYLGNDDEVARLIPMLTEAGMVILETREEVLG